MKHSRGRTLEIETLAQFDLHTRRARSMNGWHLQSLDLTERSAELAAIDPAGALLLGCRLTAGDEQDLRDRGALVFPAVPGVPVDAYRPELYSPAELYDGLADGYPATLDARIYAWAQQPRDREVSLTQALHDHAVDDALLGHVAGRSLVGVMGGHALPRGSTAYAAAARLGHALGATLEVATGGGPGAMEAANLGAYLAQQDGSDLEKALALLADVPTFQPSVTRWARTAQEVLTRWPGGADSLGVPTWHYGHEPPNLFATRIAKYFANATREHVLLHLCDAGIAFLPGAAGTVQEVFQDACENYYADDASVAPMVLVGREHWTETVPAWPLLERLAAGRRMQDRVHLVDTVEEAAAVLTAPR